jgi:Plasmid pRiA4b ORF-3-like protein
MFLEPRRGIDGLVSMAVKSCNLEHADPLDANDFHSIFTDQQGEKPTPVVAAVWLSDKRYATIDTRPHNLARVIEDAKTGSVEPYHFADSYKGPFSSAGRDILHAVGEATPKTRGTISLCHFPKHGMDIVKRAKAGVAYDTLTSWVRQVHERDAERSKKFQQRIVAHRKVTGWEMDKMKAKWLRVDVELDGIEPTITRSIIVSPLITIHRLHHQVLAPVFGRQGNIHCYAFRQCHKFSFPGQGTERSESSWKDQVARHLELVHANWIGPKASSALDGFFQPFYIGGEMADDQKIMLGDHFFQGDHDDTEEIHIRYIHDFGDWWSHTLTVTMYYGAVPPDASAVAHVLSGCGTCPPEDCGGITENIKKIQQLTGVVLVKDDFDEVEPDDKILVHPLKEMW